MYEIMFSVLASMSILLAVVGVAQLRQGSDMDERLNMSLGGSFEVMRLQDVTLSQPFSRRVILPLLRRLSRAVAWIWPENRLRAVEARLLLAGSPGHMRPLEFVAMQLVAALGLAGGGLLYGYLVAYPFSFTALLMLLGLAVGGFGMPQFWLARRITRRRQGIQNSLPDAIDMLTITTEAGLSFESGLQEIMTKWDNELSREFARTLRDIGMGQSRRYALTGMATRTGVPDVQSFVTALNQAEELGVSIGRVLRSQSEDMRVRRRQRAYEKANQAPVKIMFPLVFLIFPSIFAVLLGPAVPQLMAFGV